MMFLFASLTGCAVVGPDYVPPAASVPDAWHAPLGGGLTAGEMDPQTLASWWKTLKDPELSSLMERAVAGNLDLKGAMARVREARARRSVASADLFPAFDAAGSAKASRSREHGVGSTRSQTRSLTFDSSWELDLFGGVRRSIEASEADLGASREDLRDVLVSLLSEVALNYIDVRTYQARIEVAEANLKTLKETYDITQYRLEAGLTTQLDVEQALYNLESSRSQLPSLRTGLEGAKNRLAVLLGENPGVMHQELEKREPIPVAPVQVAVGLPADLLRRRPDIRRAERELAAQTARVGEAVADLYPKFKLTGSIGLETLSTGSLLSTGLRTSSMGLGSGITWPIFHAGAIRKNIEVQNALQEQAMIKYESTVLGALEEVENGLVAFAQEQVRRDSLTEAAGAARRAVELAEDKYRSGLIDFSELLDSQRSLLSLEDQLSQSDGTVTANLVRLYKALGGGWKSMTAGG